MGMGFIGVLKTGGSGGETLFFACLRPSVGSGTQKRRQLQGGGVWGPGHGTLNAGCAFPFLWLWFPAAGSDMLQTRRTEPGEAADSRGHSGQADFTALFSPISSDLCRLMGVPSFVYILFFSL